MPFQSMTYADLPVIITVPSSEARVRVLAYNALLNTELGLVNPATGERVQGRVLDVIHRGESQVTMRVGLGEVGEP